MKIAFLAVTETSELAVSPTMKLIWLAMVLSVLWSLECWAERFWVGTFGSLRSSAGTTGSETTGSEKTGSGKTGSGKTGVGKHDAAQESPGKLRHAVRNFGLVGVNAVLLSFLGGVTILVASQAIRWDWTLLYQIRQFPLVQFIVGLVLLDFWTYLWHRLNHRSEFLWRFHRVHHTDRAMDVTSAGRFHVGELGLSGLIRLGVIALAGLSPSQVLVHEVVLVTVAMFHHAKLDLGRFDRPLRWLIVTPGMHQIHHSRMPAEMHSNFASILSVWDRVGRSFVPQPQKTPVNLGLDGFDDDARDQSLAGMLTTPLRDERDREG